jgi:hypothetical protein
MQRFGRARPSTASETVGKITDLPFGTNRSLLLARVRREVARIKQICEVGGSADAGEQISGPCSMIRPRLDARCE